ncbi:hypothetical protein FQR65_LT14174 [Abscondita terminalis]|nr:hypothetical protein FQR65_LT14174 [Abscondita terminalis]
MLDEKNLGGELEKPIETIYQKMNCEMKIQEKMEKMKFLFVAVLLISTALSYPLGESDESKSSVSASNPNSLSVAKSDESDEKPEPQSHHHHDHDVSHENHKEVQSDSNSDESSESNESKPKEPANQNEDVKPLEAENKPEVLKVDGEIKEEKREIAPSEIQENLKADLPAPSVAEEKPAPEPVAEEAPESKSLAEEKVDIVEAANQPAAIAEESVPVPLSEDKSSVKSVLEPVKPEPALQEKSIPEGIDLVEKENSLLSEEKLEPKPEVKKEELKPELLEEKVAAESSPKIDNLESDAPAPVSAPLPQADLLKEEIAPAKEEKPLELPAKPEELPKAIPAPQAEASSSS